MIRECNECHKEKELIDANWLRTHFGNFYNTCKSCCSLRAKFNTIKRKYGITKEDYYNMLIKQNGLCGICNLPMTHEDTNIEHDHNTGKFRSLSHKKCNTLIGFCNERIEILQNAINYLKIHLDT
jgi:hypothetical protein